MVPFDIFFFLVVNIQLAVKYFSSAQINTIEINKHLWNAHYVYKHCANVYGVRVRHRICLYEWARSCKYEAR